MVIATGDAGNAKSRHKDFAARHRSSRVHSYPLPPLQVAAETRAPLVLRRMRFS